jgi:ligand-binding sensor domain-containing protein
LTAIVFGAVCFCAVAVTGIYRSVQKALADARIGVEEKDKIAFERRYLKAHPSDKIQLLQNNDDTRDMIEYDGAFYAATAGGLVRISREGKKEKHYTVLDGLPESDLTCLAFYGQKLFIGTRSKGLVTFDGKGFEGFTWPGRNAQTVTALLAFGDRLLIGTMNGGLLEFDGEKFSEIKNGGDKRILSITCLYKNASELFVGTFDSGLWLSRAGVWSHFTAADGLSSDRIVGLAVLGNDLYAAADTGLCILQGEKFREAAAIAPLSGLVALDDKLLLARDDGQIFTFRTSLDKFTSRDDLENARLVIVPGGPMLVSSKGAFRLDAGKLTPLTEAGEPPLTDNFVSALKLDGSGNLWVGSFRHGVDVIAGTGKNISHIEDDSLREINFLGRSDDRMVAATTGGLIFVGPDLHLVLASGKLPSNTVTQFSGEWTATARGLVFTGNDGYARVITTVQGLPNNSVYTVLEAGKKLYAGTLGGLAEIEDHRVIRTFRDSNSGLTTNWVTALAAADDRIFIGTYGGGVFELTPSGEIRSFESEAGKFVVNANAIFADGERLYIGTLGGAKILDLHTGVWSTLKDVLPSETVMSITGDDNAIYFGTANGVARIDKTYFATEGK